MKCDNWTDQHDTSVGQWKKSESPAGIEPIISLHQAGALSTELQELLESKVI